MELLRPDRGERAECQRRAADAAPQQRAKLVDPPFQLGRPVLRGGDPCRSLPLSALLITFLRRAFRASLGAPGLRGRFTLDLALHAVGAGTLLVGPTGRLGTSDS